MEQQLAELLEWLRTTAQTELPATAKDIVTAQLIGAGVGLTLGLILLVGSILFLVLAGLFLSSEKEWSEHSFFSLALACCLLIPGVGVSIENHVKRETCLKAPRAVVAEWVTTRVQR